MGVSIWQLVILFAVLAFLVGWLLLLGRISSKAGFSKWWALLALVPVINVIFLWVFAFIQWPSGK